jgi:cell division protein FtsZ
MPRLEDLPIPGQNELRAVRGEASGADLPEKRRMGLLQRLASVGLGRRDMPGEGESPEAHRPPQLEPPRPSNRPGAGRQNDSRSASDPASEYGKKHGHQGLDPLGRQAPVNNSPEEDQLEIPAFLRRQAT